MSHQSSARNNPQEAKMMAKVIGICTLIVILIGVFFGTEAQIEWTMYLDLPLVILAGSAGVAFITSRFEAIICGAVIAALWPALLEAIEAAILI
jgi:hypothetical protein